MLISSTMRRGESNKGVCCPPRQEIFRVNEFIARKSLAQRIPKALRIAAFLGFLKSKTSEIPVERLD